MPRRWPSVCHHRRSATAGQTTLSTSATASSRASDIPEGFVTFPFADGFIGANGPLYVERSEAACRLGFRVEARHCNPMGILHGGMMATFCDMLLPISAHVLSAALAGRFLPTVSLQVDYLGPSPLGSWVQGEAQLLRSTRTLVFLQGLVQADGTPVARTSGVFKIGPPFAGRFDAAPG